MLDNGLESYITNVTSWWAWSLYRIRYGADKAGHEMALAFAEARVKPAYQA